MKTLKLFVSVLVIAFIVICNPSNAQTIQQKLYAEYDNVFTPCINLNLSGSYILNCTFHLDKKTGKMDRLHINMMQSDCWVTETGERVTILESTNDKLGIYWDIMNNINYYNGVPDMYNVEDGWMDEYIPDVLPSEGVMIDMNWRFIMKGGGNFVMATMIMTHLNARGELVVDKLISRADCNE